MQVLDTKNKIKELSDFLAQQFVEYEKQQEKKKFQKIRNELAKKNYKNRFSSFTNSLHRPQFINQIKENDLFEQQSIFINKDVPQLTNLQKSLLISPDRNQNITQQLNYLFQQYINQIDQVINREVSFLLLEKDSQAKEKLVVLNFGIRISVNYKKKNRKKKAICYVGKLRSKLQNEEKQNYSNLQINVQDTLIKIFLQYLKTQQLKDNQVKSQVYQKLKKKKSGSLIIIIFENLNLINQFFMMNSFVFPK
ncbi:unnamed protein product [Paramecium sonneborni]|uniref:Uncharacterized protein n=1 Tax=Paramecium sonneborni TaxID=65129 RepID=A0A8S1RSY4_9CILI|nr:unnamed protein product [Paramecium sonneborni]